MVGNISTPTIVGTDVIQFIVDDTPPAVGITLPSQPALSTLATITGTVNAALSGASISM